jgi:hypothetical protein
MPSRFSIRTVACLAVGSTTLAMAGLAGPALAAGHPGGIGTLIKVSHDPYQNDGAQHATEAEPDTFAWGDTVISVFQVGRYGNGGASNTGWATSTDGGVHWKHGYLPGITVAEGGDWARVSDPSVVYDAQDKLWLVTGLVIDSAVNGRGVVVSSSTDGLNWKKPVLAAGNNSFSYDKEWISCDNTKSSPHYGNCYVEVDLSSAGDKIVMVTSKDGGKTWGPERSPSGAFGLGGQPLVQPDGTVVVPYSADFSSQDAFTSTDGGASWNPPVLISTITDHIVPGVREEPLPSANMDAKGKIYVVWDDCRFRSGCSSNDIVMSTSSDGKHWSDVVRVPIDGVKSGLDHFDPGLGVSPTLSGSQVKLGLYYYYYPKAACAISDCRLDVGYVSSADAGKHWSAPVQLAGPMHLDWLAQAGGAMVGDYISCDVIGKTAVSVFAVGFKPKGAVKDQAMYSAGPMPVTGGTRPARSEGVRFTGPAPAHTYPLPLS